MLIAMYTILFIWHMVSGRKSQNLKLVADSICQHRMLHFALPRPPILRLNGVQTPF